MTTRNLRTSMTTLLALVGCSTEGVPAITNLDSGAGGSSGPRRGPSGQAGDAGASDVLAVVLCTALSFAGCDGGGGGDLVPDAGLSDTQVSTDVLRVDTGVAPDTTKLDTGSQDTGGYTPNGVTVNLGSNPCQSATLHPECEAPQKCGWDPTTNKCFNISGQHLDGVCDETKWCSDEAFPPGTLLVWSSSDLRYKYLGDPSGGYVCLLNVQALCPQGGCASALLHCR